MKCKQAETQVAAYADGELDALRTYSIKQHLHGCANCTAMHHDILVLRARIRAEVPKFVASPVLHARVRAMVGLIGLQTDYSQPWGYFAVGAIFAMTMACA